MDTGTDGWWLAWHAEFRSDGHYDMKIEPLEAGSSIGAGICV